MIRCGIIMLLFLLSACTGSEEQHLVSSETDAQHVIATFLEGNPTTSALSGAILLDEKKRQIGFVTATAVNDLVRQVVLSGATQTVLFFYRDKDPLLSAQDRASARSIVDYLHLEGIENQLFLAVAKNSN